jgi:hypothetical protein
MKPFKLDENRDMIRAHPWGVVLSRRLNPLGEKPPSSYKKKAES